jgi:hypothetical protein
MTLTIREIHERRSNPMDFVIWLQTERLRDLFQIIAYVSVEMRCLFKSKSRSPKGCRVGKYTPFVKIHSLRVVTPTADISWGCPLIVTLSVKLVLE